MGFLSHAMDAVLDHLSGVTRLLFIPFASHEHQSYAARVAKAFSHTGITIVCCPADGTAPTAISNAEACFVGGGNSFRLLTTLMHLNCIQPLRNMAIAGMPYIGASAGTNLACPTIRTTNDMPIVVPPSLEALNLIPFQINPHYCDRNPDSTHQGETREQRIMEFLEENDVPVLGLREGSWCMILNTHLELGGSAGARLFRRHHQPEEYVPPCSMDMLLTVTPHFDTPLE